MALTQLQRDNQIKPGSAYNWVTNDSSGKMSQSAVTGSRAVATNSLGLPVASTTTDAQLGYLQGLVGLVNGDIIYVDGSGHLADAGIVASNIFLADGSKDATADFNLGAFKITNLANPTSAQDAATKAYVDAIASGLSPKAASRAATTGALPAVTYSGGGVGATLTETANGALPAQDGVTLVVNDRLLVKNQAAALQNGIYTVTQVGDAGTPFILTRATDFDGSAGLGTVEGGSFTFVTNGTTQANTGWSVVWSGIVTVGTDPINFTQTSAAGTYLAGSGLDLTGNTFSISTDNSLVANAGNSDPSLVVQNSPTGAIYTAADGLAIQLETTNPTLQIDGGDHLGAKLNNAGAIVTGASGLTVSVDNSTINISANAIEVKTGGITDTQVSATAAIQYSKLMAAGTDGQIQFNSAGTFGADGFFTRDSSGDLSITDQGSGVFLNINSDSNGHINFNNTAASTQLAEIAAQADGSLLLEVNNGSFTFDFTSLGSIQLPVLSNATQPPSPIEGEFIYNTSIHNTQVWDGTEWVTPLTTALTSAHIFVGNGSNIATDTAVTGDVSITNAGVTSISSGLATHFVTREVPTGLINSSNVTYTLANTPTTGTECVYLNGLLQNAGGNDYSISTNTITFTVAPETGSVILVNYQK